MQEKGITKKKYFYSNAIVDIDYILSESYKEKFN